MTPDTSTTLLREISSDADNARWPEFVARYRPMMLAYLKSHFPAVDAGDVVQETLIALSKALPNYRYDPGENGRFKNYLTGIPRNKSLKWCKQANRDRALKNDLISGVVPPPPSTAEMNEAAWRESLLEIAMYQLLANERIPDKSKQIFQRLTVDGASPDEVAIAYGTSRNNIDKTKSRIMARLREIVRALEAAGDA